MAKVTMVAAKDWFEFPDLAELDFDNLVREYWLAHILEMKSKERKDELKVEIEAALLVVGEKKLKVGNLTAIQCNGSTASKLDKHQLVEAGVDPDTIKACTVPGTKYTYVQVIEEGEEVTPPHD